MKTNKQDPARRNVTRHKVAQREWEPLFKNGEQILDIRYDPIFKAVFTRGTVKSRAALSDLISSLIGRTVMVKNIIANEPPINDTRQKHVRFDVVCRTKTGEFVNVEMSFNPSPYEPVRLEYYTARLFTGQNAHGKKRNYHTLKETYQIAILAKKKLFKDEQLIHDFIYYDPKRLVSLRGKTRIITVELVKTKPIVDKPAKEMSNAEAWAVFFQYLTNMGKRGKIREIIKKEEGIAMAVSTLGTFTKKEIEYFRNLSLLKGELDYQDHMSYATERGLKKGLREGRKKGREEGRDEANLENAKKMKADNMPVSQISKYTGLSVETIEKL